MGSGFFDLSDFNIFFWSFLKPVYKTLNGWKSKTQGIKKFDDLPNNAKIYVKAIEEFIETKISSISTSPERKDTILLVDPFNY